MRLLVIYDSILRKWNSLESGIWESENKEEDEAKPGILEKLLSKMTDFSFVDANGNKFVDIMFKTYVENIEVIDVGAGKRLLELGGDKSLLQDELSEKIVSHTPASL